MQKETKTHNFRQSQKKRKVVLGRGLDALIPESEPLQNLREDYFQCDIHLIRPNPFQPRHDFSETELAELAKSIEQQGVLQPLLVRKADTGYELITGERRLRAAKLAGLGQVPVLIKEVSDRTLLEMSIIENIQREDLNPLEEAEAYHRLIEEFNLTQDQAASRVGKSRPAVANLLRLRQLPEPIKSSIRDGTLSMGHARALLGADNPAQQNAAWRQVIAKGLSVRQTEELVKRLKEVKKKSEKPAEKSEDVYYNSVAEDLSRQLGTRVQIRRHGKKGKLEIEFYSDEDLDRLLGLFNRLV
ncbi:MAG: ParB/RepB/Spo0J family partition protein [Deltaproteobacteria bacterium]|nr:ParB/RepB/Spo0J family partition protein [Deltaproteobacteria bacterium]MBW1960109.1 ParB/RepB/Spo0J family partition protein [Deltaproteobacteria bacterium]MBW1994438.1 ParB/RepB/Spo0J family partition protein [Deltaproteobacteria bacterium]MBW2153487.1 ParB/RepB/Spo0J family partition protein [Deltaproteobacteria bacterium]